MGKHKHPAKRVKSACIICLQETHFTDKRDTYAKLLVNQFVSPFKTHVNSEIFEFCIDCIKIVEDLNELQEKLDFIMENIKKKKEAIRIKIVTTSDLYDYEENSFRSIAARDLYKNVESKNQNDNICKVEYSTNYDHSDTAGGDSQLLEAVQLASVGENDAGDGMMMSEMVCIQLKQELPYEEESIVEFEPWNESACTEEESKSGSETIRKVVNVEPIENIISSRVVNEKEKCNYLAFGEATSNDRKTQDNKEHEFPIKVSKNIFQSNEKRTSRSAKNSPRFPWYNKPALTETEITMLAIITSKNKQLSISEIWEFVSENFPYFPGNNHGSWKSNVELFVSTSVFVTAIQNDVDTSTKYAISNSEHFDIFLKCLHEKLHNTNLFRSMAYPDRLPSFKNCLLEHTSRFIEMKNNERKKEGQIKRRKLPIIEEIKVWDRPPLNYVELSILAVISQNRMEMTLADIFYFISSNFPFFSRPTENNTLKTGVRNAVNQCPYIDEVKKRQDKSAFVFALAKSKPYLKNQVQLYEKLNAKDFSKSMAFPERLPTFRRYLLGKVPEVANSSNPTKVNESSATEEIESSAGEGKVINVKIESNEVQTCEPTPFKTIVSSNEDGPMASQSQTSRVGSSPGLSVFTWPKPVLNSDQLCILSIMNSGSKVASFQDIFSFITENFPFFQKDDVQPSCEVVIKSGLSQRIITAYIPPENNADGKDEKEHYFDKYMYTIKENHTTESVRMKIADILRSVKSLDSMAYPDRAEAFIENVMTKQIDRSELNRYFIK